MASVLLVGKGPPERGGIPTFLSSILASRLRDRHRLSFENLTRPTETPQGGRASLTNVRRTLEDAARVFRAAADAEIVHVHTAAAPAVTLVRAGVLALAARLRGAQVIIHAHGGRLQLWLTSALRRRVARLALRPAHVVVAVSRGAEVALRSVAASRVERIDNGIDAERFVPRSRPGDRVPRLLFVGVLSPRKGLVDLFDASRILRRRGVAHELVIVGGMPDEGPAAEAAVVAAAEGIAELPGSRPVEDMPEIFASADVFCLPSWWEAMPLTVLEAFASGLPVVATSVGDLPRLVEDGVNGRLVPPRDPTALADALEPLLKEPDTRTAWGRAARRTVESAFTLDVVIGALDRLYSRLQPPPRTDP